MRASLLLLCFLPAWGQVPCGECFPIESLSARQQEAAVRAVWGALDSEGLYTWIGGTRPLVLGRQFLFIDESPESLARLEELRAVAAALRCGSDIGAEVVAVGPVYYGRRFWHLALYNREAIRRTVAGQRDLFGKLGISEATRLAELLRKLDDAEDPDDTTRGYAFLFGFPRYSVDFQVQRRIAERQGKRLPYGSVSLPTFERKTFGYVWFAPRGHQENEDDRRRKAEAETILKEYRKRRDIQSADPAALLREWYRSGSVCDWREARVY